jgi:hypothetical protein
MNIAKLIANFAARFGWFGQSNPDIRSELEENQSGEVEDHTSGNADGTLEDRVRRHM